MARPPGCTFLGARATSLPVHLGKPDQAPVQAIIDSGSDITLISQAALAALPDAPRARLGQKIKLVQVTGNATITGYVPLDIYFETTGGKVQLNVEAYVVQGMTAPFLLGNDFADQYSVSIVRSDGTTSVQFGKPEWSARTTNSVDGELLDEEGRTFRVRAARDVVIQPGESKLIPVTAPFASGETELYVERVLNVTRNEEDVYGATDCMISSANPQLHVANFSAFPARIGRGQELGRAHKPVHWLDKADRYNASQRSAMEAHANLLTKL
ncbi:hypothetical protein OH76DRAFT_1357922, partial [Lentinus brumalis]